MLVPVDIKVFDWFGIFCKPMGISWVAMMDPMILKQSHVWPERFGTVATEFLEVPTQAFDR